MPEGFTDSLPLSRSTLDRSAADRDAPGWLDTARADPSTRVAVLAGDRALMAEGEPLRLDLLPVGALPEAELVVWLGRTTEPDRDPQRGTAVLGAVVGEDAAAALPDRWRDLRTTGAELDARDAGIFTQLLAIANWHRASRFSPRSGEPTEPARGGWVRHPAGFDDEASGEHVFPRTDPAVIVGVVDGEDRLLLASNAAWPEDRWSVVAGFVEPGESFEAAVRREVLEETAVVVDATEYLGSQPWPFPRSIMIGFLARTTERAPEPHPDGDEIRAARFFARDALLAAVESAEVRLPGRTSIARAIIERWYGGPLGTADW